MKNEIQLKENSEGELPLIENDLSKIEKYLIELADNNENITNKINKKEKEKLITKT